MTIETFVTLVILAIIAVAIFYIISVWVYKRAPANMGFIRTGFGGTKVCLGQGAMQSCIPMLVTPKTTC